MAVYLSDTLYRGIYSAEYTLRMSTIPRSKYVASFQCLAPPALTKPITTSMPPILLTNNGTTTNTAGLNFGFFLSAQVAGEAVANGALYRSTGVYATTTTGGPTVPTYGGGSVPCGLMRKLNQRWKWQALCGVDQQRRVQLAGRSDKTGRRHAGQRKDKQVPRNIVTGSDPSLVNSNPPPNNVQIQTRTGGNPVTISSLTASCVGVAIV